MVFLNDSARSCAIRSIVAAPAVARNEEEEKRTRAKAREVSGNALGRAPAGNALLRCSSGAEAIRKQIDGVARDYDKEKLQERVAKLAGGGAVIEVGAATEVKAPVMPGGGKQHLRFAGGHLLPADYVERLLPCLTEAGHRQHPPPGDRS